MSESHKVVLTFSDKFGYVSEIADKMSKNLMELGLIVDTINLERTKESQWPSMNDYNGVIVISGQKSFWTFWNKKAKKFASYHIGQFEGEKKIGFFRSAPHSHGILLDPVKTNEKFGKDILRTCHFIPDFYEDFGPVFDFSRKSKIKYEDRKSFKDIAKSIGKKTGLVFEYKGYNDFRNWTRIEKVCNEFAEEVQKGNTCSSCANIIPKGVEYCPNCGAKM